MELKEKEEYMQVSESIVVTAPGRFTCPTCKKNFEEQFFYGTGKFSSAKTKYEKFIYCKGKFCKSSLRFIYRVKEYKSTSEVKLEITRLYLDGKEVDREIFWHGADIPKTTIKKEKR